MITVICVSLIMMDMALLQAQHAVRPIFVGMTAGLVIKFILNIILIRLSGIIGASISTVVSLIIFGTIIHIAVTRKYHLHAMRRFFYQCCFRYGIYVDCCSMRVKHSDNTR